MSLSKNPLSCPMQVARDRFELIRPYVERGSVLDVGCVDARPDREGYAERIKRKPNPLFRQIVETNPDTLGVDIDPEGVEELKKLGYKMVCGDAQTIDLGRQFDAVVAGELIEHLENPGQFLRNMRRHLKPDGVLLLSTPNPFAATSIWRVWRYGRPQVHEEHTCWFDPITLSQLLQRTGFRLESGNWLNPKPLSLRTLPRVARAYFAHSFLLTARPAA